MLASKHRFGVAVGNPDEHHHPHDPSDIVEWVVTFLAIAFAVTMICALAFQIGRP